MLIESDAEKARILWLFTTAGPVHHVPLLQAKLLQPPYDVPAYVNVPVQENSLSPF